MTIPSKLTFNHTPCILCFAIGAVSALAIACFFCSIGATADGLLDLISTLIVSIAFGYYLTRKKSIQDADSHEKRSYARTGIPRIREKIDSLTEILESATFESTTFPNLDRRSKSLIKDIRFELELLQDCFQRVFGQNNSVLNIKISSLSKLVDAMESNWSEASGNELTPENLMGVKDHLTQIVKDINAVYLDTIDRS